jgi:NAD(P)-dependent dehydrogenase (short-subunit alcohol dehydrogenase family)
MTSEYLDGAGAADLLAHVPLGRIGEPHEISALVEFLLGDDAAYLTGAVIPIAGGRNV